MSKDWSDQTRYADTKRYLETVDAELANHVHQTLPCSTQAAGAALSLKGNKLYALAGNSSVGRAVRALLLCHKAYLGANWSKGTGNLGAGIPANLKHATGPQLTMDTYLGKSEAAVRLAIQSYVALNP